MVPIPIPKELVNDDAYLVAAMLAEPGQAVARGQALAELETSKASLTLSSPADGFFRPGFAVGDMAPVGAVFGHIAQAPAAEGGDEAAPAATDESAGPDPRFSAPAWELFQSSPLALESFAGLAHVRRSDVEAVLAAKPAVREEPAAADRDALVLLGGGGHCRECIDLVEAAGRPAILGVIDTRAKPGSLIYGHPVLGDNSYLPRLRERGFFALALAYAIAGSQADRDRHFRELLELGHVFPPLVHPRAIVSPHASLGRGVQIMGGALVGSEAKVGDMCLVNSNAVVSHDCVLGDNVHVAPGAVLAGNVRVGPNSVIGMGASVYMRVAIGRDVVVYNGAAVFADVPDGMVVRENWSG